MKRTGLFFTSMILAICFSVNVFAQTAGTLTFTLTQVAHSGSWGAKHNLAIWVQNSTGTFVKTKMRYFGNGTSDHLPTWVANSASNVTDATTGATLSAYGTRTFTWDGKNVSGTVNGTIVTDGVYKVTVEETWNHGTAGTIVKSYTFAKGAVADHQAPANDANFTGVTLDWVPATAPVIPTITTTAATAIATTTATSGGNISADGGATVSARGVCWGTVANPTIANSLTSNGTGIGVFTSNLSGLTANTLYHVRAYATNSAGTAYGTDLTFTTTAPVVTVPTVTTTAATAIALTTATSGGNVTADGGATVSARGVCWSLTINPTIANSLTSDATGLGVFTSSITGLTSNTTYHVRAYATNSAGTAYGTDLTFTTAALPAVFPTVTTTVASGITNTTASSGGNVTADGGATVSARGVCWSLTANPTIVNSLTSDGIGTGVFTSSITGLTSNTTYHVRAYATNSAGTAYGADLTFTTSAVVATVPTVTTTAASAIAQTTASSGGNVTADGGATVSARGVCWGATANPTIANSLTIDGTGTGVFTSSITGLTANTTYHVRAYATNSAGTAYGADLTFTTTSIPVNGAWILQSSGFTTASRGIGGISIVDANVAWAWAYDASGGGASCRDLTVTKNGGASWTPRVGYTTANYSISNISAIDSLVAYAGFYPTAATYTFGGRVRKTTNGGVNWTSQTTAAFGATSFLDFIHFFDANNGIAVGDPINGKFEVYTTVNGGTNWILNTDAGLTAATGLASYINDFNAVGNTIWFGSNSASVYKSTDKGVTWTSYSTGLTEVQRVEFENANNGFAFYDGTTPAAAKSTDGGATWTAYTMPVNIHSTGIAMVPGLANTYVTVGAATGDLGSSYTSDYGITFNKIDTGVQYTSVKFYNQNVGYAGGINTSATVGGIYKWVGAPALTCDATPASIPSGSSSQLSATALGGYGAYTYSWTSNPAGFTSPAASASVSPTVNTSYTVNVQSAFNTATANCAVTITAPIPVADFSGNPTTVNAGGSVSFTDLSTNTPTSWNWTFTGGTPSSSTSQNPTIVYNTPGTYSVALTATNAAGNNTVTKVAYVTVNAVVQAPVADFSGNPTTVNAGGSVSFTDLSTNTPTSWNWTFTGGTPSSSTSQNPTIVYNTPGTYSVALTATNAAGNNTVTKVAYVTVNAVVQTPVADFSGNPTTVNAGGSVAFTDLSTNTPTGWSWTFTGGTPSSSTSQNPTIVYNTSGTYEVALTATNAAGNNTVTKVAYITVNTVAQAPVADFSGNPTTVNVGGSVAFTDLSTNSPIGWNWTFTGGTPSTSSQQNPSVVYNTPGTYAVALTVANSVGINTVTKTAYITVNTVAPAPVADFSGNPTTLNVGSSVAFTDLSTHTPTSWSWTFTGGTPSSSTVQNPAIVYNVAGTYAVSLTATNAAGNNMVTKSAYITVNNATLAPSANFAANITTVSAGGSVSFTDLSTNAPTSWSWTFSGGTPFTSSLQNPTVTYSSTGVYNVVLTVSNGIGTNMMTKTAYIVVNSQAQAPLVNFYAIPTSVAAGGTINFTDVSSNTPSTWSWIFAGGTPSSSNLQSPSVVYNTPGTFDVVLTATNAGGSNTMTKAAYVNIMDPLAVANIESNVVSLYPNPAQTQFTVDGNAAIKKIEIFNITGKIVYQQNEHLQKCDVNIKHLPEGIYFVKITNENSSVIRKLIKQ